MRGCVHLLLPLAQIARGPVELAEAVQNRPFNAVLRVGLKRYVLGVVVFLYRADQAEDAGVD